SYFDARQSTLSVARSRLHWACAVHRCWLHCNFMQRYSENCVRGPQTSRGLAGARATCCCVARFGAGATAAGGGATAAGGGALAGGSAVAAAAAAACGARSAPAGRAGAAAPGGASAAAGSVGSGCATSASGIGVLDGNADVVALASGSATGGSVGIGFTLATSAAVGDGAGAAVPTADTASLSPTAIPWLTPRASSRRPSCPSWPNSKTPITSS